MAKKKKSIKLEELNPRIVVLSNLWQIWERNPELRLAQLVENYHSGNRDPYYMEDNEYIREMARYYGVGVKQAENIKKLGF